MKKLLSVLLCLVLVFALLPHTALPAHASTWNGFTYEFCDDSKTGYRFTEYNGTATSVTIPAYIDGKPVLELGMGLFKGKSSLQSVTFPSNSQLRLIDPCAFMNCSSLQSIEIPASLMTMGNYAFYGCSSLESLTFLGNNLTVLDDSVFSGCSKLTEVEIPDSVTTLKTNVFSECEQLSRVTIPTSVTKIGCGSFVRCGNLGEINYAGSKAQWDAIDIGYYDYSISPESMLNDALVRAAIIFDGCDAEDGSDYYAAGFCGAEGTNLAWTLTNAGNMTITGKGAMPDWNGSTYAPWFWFYGSITSLFIAPGTTNIGNSAFSGQYNMTSALIPATVTTIGDYAFCACTGLLGAELPEGVTRIGVEAFTGCTALQSVVLPSTVTVIGASAFNSCSSLTIVEIPYGVTFINFGTFYGCSDLESVTIPSSVGTIYGSAFRYCSSLQSVTIPVGVTSIGSNAFGGCSALTDVYYAGTPDQWNDVYKEEDILPAGAVVHYTCKVTFNANGGTGSMAPQSIYSGTATKLTANAFTRSGYGFTGWNTKANGTGTAYADKASVTLSGDLTLYAQWELGGGPTITAQPKAASVTAGSKAYFTVTATGTGTLTYQWQYSTNGTTWYDTSLTGYNTKTLTVTASSAVNGRYYRCIVTDSKGSVASAGAKLTVVPGPAITGQPASVTKPAGSKAYFTVTASGTGTLTYQWQYSTNGTTWYNTSLTGYNTKTLTVTASSTVNGRYYRCIVTDSKGSATSAAAKLTVTSATGPTITGQPASVTKAAGAKAYFTVTATGTGTLTYKWQYSTNGSAWYDTSLTGYNTKTLTVTASSTVNGRYYRCIVTDSKGSVTSSAAKLTVT